MPATYVATVPICGYKLPRARMCGTYDFKSLIFESSLWKKYGKQKNKNTTIPKTANQI